MRTGTSSIQMNITSELRSEVLVGVAVFPALKGQYLNLNSGAIHCNRWLAGLTLVLLQDKRLLLCRKVLRTSLHNSKRDPKDAQKRI